MKMVTLVLFIVYVFLFESSNQTPVFTSLPTAAFTIQEEEKAQILMHTLVIDNSATGNDFTCQLNPTNSRFFVRYISTTTDVGIYSKARADFAAGSSSYTLTVECVDDGDSSSDTETFTVNINPNSAPTITPALGTAAVDARADGIGTLVTTVVAVDPNSDETRFAISCAVTTCPFTIADDGRITLTRGIATETIASYTVTVTPSDVYGNVGTSDTLTVNINNANSEPTITNLPLATRQDVAENSGLGASVFQVIATDANMDTLTYNVEYTPASCVELFTLNTANGLVSTHATNTIDYEPLAVSTCDLNIYVSDGLSQTNALLELDVTDVNEPPTFSQTEYAFSVDEGPATTIFPTRKYSATDPEGASLTYTLNCGADTSKFLINSTTGDLSYSAAYDNDVVSPTTTVTCTITASDDVNTGTTSLVMYIDYINDYTPAFIPATYTQFVDPYADIGTSVLQLTASDADLGVVTHGSIYYELSAVTAGSTDYFAVTQTGEIYTKSSLSSFAGTSTTFDMIATVRDLDGLSSTATVKITTLLVSTTVTMVTTEYFKTFWDDGRNVVWISCAGIATALIAAAVVVICLRNNYFEAIIKSCQESCKSKPKVRNVKPKEAVRPRRDMNPIRRTVPITPPRPPSVTPDGAWEPWKKDDQFI